VPKATPKMAHMHNDKKDSYSIEFDSYVTSDKVGLKKRKTENNPIASADGPIDQEFAEPLHHSESRASTPPRGNIKQI